jgi:hypothetical protein
MEDGKYQGMPVQDAKSRVRDDLIESGDAMAYAEPEKEVRSRSGDVCVVALCDQVSFLQERIRAYMMRIRAYTRRIRTYMMRIRAKP